MTLPEDACLFIDPGKEHFLKLTPAEIKQLSIGDSINEDFPQEEIATRDLVAHHVEKFDQVVSSLRELLADYPEVLEGYFVEANQEQAQGMLGILTRDLRVETRFVLIDKVAEISRSCLGAAGAIEVFDDLNLTTSSSWELFNAKNPFYVNET